MNAERDAALVIEQARVDYCLSYEIAGKLNTAGLLVTDLHRRALEACETYARTIDKYVPPQDILGASVPDWRESSRLECYRVGRESLAAKQPPKPRWTVMHHGPTDSWDVWHSKPLPVSPPVTQSTFLKPMMTGLSEAQARAVADALNALEPKP